MSEPDKLKNRRSFTAEFKFQVVMELIRGERSLSSASVHYRIKDSVLSRWKQEFLARAPQVFAEPSEHASKEVEQLQKIIGEQAIELAILKKAYGISTRKFGGNS